MIFLVISLLFLFRIPGNNTLLTVERVILSGNELLDKKLFAISFKFLNQFERLVPRVGRHLLYFDCILFIFIISWYNQ